MSFEKFESFPLRRGLTLNLLEPFSSGPT